MLSGVLRISVQAVKLGGLVEYARENHQKPTGCSECQGRAGL